MSIKISVFIVASMLLLQTFSVQATMVGEQKPSIPAVTKPAETKPQIKNPIFTGTAHRMKERPSFKMTCPDPDEVTLNLSYTAGGWSINPSQLRPQSFSRAYATVDPADKSKVILACLYEVTADYVAKTPYNGLQKCISNPATGGGKVGYTGPSGYTTNVAGTTAPGNLHVKKTGEQVKDQSLECQFRADGQAQFFKKYQATGNLSTCRANGREVTCPY